MQKLMTFFRSGMGTVILVAVVIVSVILAVWAYRSFNNEGVPNDVRYSWYMDSVTGEPFRHLNADGDPNPLPSPKGNPSYSAEACYWNADGTIKKTPTYVLLNHYVGKPEPTFCPDCGRLVKPRNPRPSPDSKPPPLQSEYTPAGGGNR